VEEDQNIQARIKAEVRQRRKAARLAQAERRRTGTRRPARTGRPVQPEWRRIMANPAPLWLLAALLGIVLALFAVSQDCWAKNASSQQSCDTIAGRVAAFLSWGPVASSVHAEHVRLPSRYPFFVSECTAASLANIIPLNNR
jgi:hypothetical protein